MLSVAETAKLLSRYGDLLGLLAILPILSELKFGALLRRQDRAMAAEIAESAEQKKEDAAEGEKKKGAESGNAKGSAASKAPAQEEDTAPCGPPLWCLLLLLVAEIIASMPLLDPSDKQTRRAVGVVMRSQRSTQSGFVQTIQSFEKVIADADVYQLARFVSIVAGLGSLIFAAATAATGSMQDARAAREGGMFGALKLSVQQMRTAFVSVMLRPRLWAVLVVLVGYVLAHRATLAKVAAKPAVLELLRASGGLFRTMGLVGAALTARRGGPMPAWSTMQVVATGARAASLAVAERASLAGLLGNTASVALKSGLALEAFSFLALLPQALSRRRMVLACMALLLPCVLLALGGEYAAPLEPLLKDMGQRLGVSVAVISLFLIFMGGFPTMMICLALAKLLFSVHKLDKVKF